MKREMEAYDSVCVLGNIYTMERDGLLMSFYNTDMRGNETDTTSIRIRMKQVKELRSMLDSMIKGCEEAKKKPPVPSEILLWSNSTGFIRISEGSGVNLSSEDEENGYVDYIMLDYMMYDGKELAETDGAQVMLTQLYQEQFHTTKDVVNHLIKYNWIPNVNYTKLYAK